jgi:hypothetical protein
MIEAATIVLTVSALIRCISEGSILGQREPSWLVDGGAFPKGKDFLLFFLTGRETRCLIGQEEGWNGMNLRKRTRFSQSIVS